MRVGMVPRMEGLSDPRCDVANQALDRSGAGSGELIVVRDGLSLLARRGDVVVRVRPRSEEPVAAREVAVALALADAAVPVTTLVDPGDQPWTIGASVVTAWSWSASIGSAGPAELGTLARMLAQQTGGGPAYEVPRFDPLTAIRRTVEHLPVGDDQADTIRRLAHGLGPAWAAAADSDPAGVTIVHGDLHRDNVVVTASGPLLTDLELAGSGPPSYDTAPVVVAVRRYGADPSTLDPFLVALGRDPRDWDGFAACVEVYELWATAWAVGVRHQSPELATEAARRVASLVDHNDEPWHLH